MNGLKHRSNCDAIRRIALIREVPRPLVHPNIFAWRRNHASPGVGLRLKRSGGRAARPNHGRLRTGGRAETTYGRRSNLCSSVGSRHMQFRHLLLSLVLALIVAGPLPARADCVYRKLKLGRSGGEVRQEWRVI